VSTNQLRVAIVGGGIGGLAAANALIRQGIDVRVYEQAPVLTEVGAGVALHPNGVRMLRRLGFGDELTRCGARWLNPQYRRSDGLYIAPMWPAELLHQIEVYGLHRADLLGMLVDRLPGEIVMTGHRCVAFEQDDAQAIIHFANGVRATADVVIAADGIHSTLQRFVVAPAAPLHSGSVAYRGVIPATSVSWPSGAMRNWLGAGKYFLVYPVRAGELINYVGFVRTGEQMKESWSAPGDSAALAREFAGWDPMVEAVIAQVTTPFRWDLYDREPLPTWTSGRLALLGDAAHPMLSHGGQGANQAMEDAVTLATVLSQTNRASVRRALQVYASLRQERTVRIQRSARINGVRYSASDGDLVARDRQLAAQAQERAWIWNYDAEIEAATVAGSF
jgi:salicylate hydroxylase